MNWFKNLKIKTKMIVSFSLVIILMLGMAAFAVIEMKEVADKYEYAINHPMEAEVQMRIFDSSISNLRRITTMMNLQSVNNDPSSIGPLYNDAVKEYRKGLDALEAYENTINTGTLSEKAIAALEQVAAVRTVFVKYKTEVCDNVAEAARAGDFNGALAFAGAGAEAAATLAEGCQNLIDLSSASASANVTGAMEKADIIKKILFIVAFAAAVLALVLAFFVAGLISKPLIRLVDVAENVANGNLNVNIDNSSKDESGMLAEGFRHVIEVVNMLVKDLSDLEHVIDVEGDIEARVDSSNYSGSYKDVANSINTVINGVINDSLTFIDSLTKIGNGEFNLTIAKLPGKKIILNETIDMFLDIMNSINKDINTLVSSALNGQLSNRADAAAYKGDWATLVGGLNNLMDAVSAPAIEISKVMEHIAAGDFESKMAGSYKGDFLALQNSINSTVDNIASYIDEISDVLHKLSQDDFDQEVTREYVGSFSHIKDALNNIIDTFNNVLGDIGSAAEQVSHGAKSISESSMSMATGASEQAASVEELNATVLTINESTAQNSESAKNAEALSEHSKRNAAIGDNDMKNMLVSMSGIKESSNSISKIIKVIEDIAFQTNLLALNAAVEAARAGEHGKGFAVVAEEVRTLAGRSQEAAKETSLLIEESISRVDEGTQIADKTADALRTIIEDISKIADIISGIANSSQEQSEAISQVTIGLAQITNVVQNNSATSEESASASEQLSSQAELLHNLVSVFKMKRK